MPRLYSWRVAAAITFVALPLGLRAERAYRVLPRLRGNRAAKSLPSLSIIVPARNEAANLEQLLPSLAALRYPGSVEVIVVDDNSTDGTAAIAASYRAQVVRLKELPSGWLGKPNACHRGAQTARGDWLLFTDADTVHAPNGPAEAVACAMDRGLDGLSLFLGHECRPVLARPSWPSHTGQGTGQSNWVERLTLATAFGGLFAGLSPKNSMLNGQYILLRRDVYLRSGGFSLVRGEMLEDVALGHRLRELGYRVRMLRGEDAAAVHMYGSTHQMWQGLTRLGAGSLHWNGPGALITALFITAVMSPLVAAAGALTGRLDRWWVPATWGVAALSMAPWTQRFGAPATALISPAGALLVQVAAVWGLGSRLLGRGIRWKGRRV